MKETESFLAFKRRPRAFHWVIAIVFFAMFFTGLVLFTPSLSSLAAGGWTRTIHRAFAVALVGLPTLWAIMHPGAAREWLRHAAFWRPVPAGGSRWKVMHKSLVVFGFLAFVLSGGVAWFLKGSVSSDTFQNVIIIHDIAFISAASVLLFHLYSEANWWLFKRYHCRTCTTMQCLTMCARGAVKRGADGELEYHPERCNGCRACMEACRRLGLYRKQVVPARAGALEPEAQPPGA